MTGPIISTNMDIKPINQSSGVFDSSKSGEMFIFGDDRIGGLEDYYTSDLMKNQFKTKALDLLAQSKRLKKDAKGNISKSLQESFNKRIIDLKKQAENEGIDLNEIFSEIVNDSNMTRNQRQHIQKTFGVSLSSESYESAESSEEFKTFGFPEIKFSSLTQKSFGNSKVNSFGIVSKGQSSVIANSVQNTIKKTYAKSPKIKLDKAFLNKTKDIADKIDCDYNDLLAVMNSESRLNSTARNSKSNATGLIQFMPRTAKELGTTVEELKAMTPVEQLDYVEKFFIKVKNRYGFKGKKLSGADLYALVFMPARAKNDVLTSDTDGKSYRWNKGLDKDGDNKITKADLEKHVASCYVDESKVFS